MNRLYVVATWVPRKETITVGSLGPVTFARGWYAYVGSARRGRDARVARHMRADKPLRWHADYLFSRHPATRSWLVDTELTECELAAALRDAAQGTEADVSSVGRTSLAAGLAGRKSGARAPTFTRFGASDCGCPGHLAYAARLWDRARLFGSLEAAVDDRGCPARPWRVW